MSIPTFPIGTDLCNQRYSIDAKLGEGGFGEVYLVTHRELGAQFALKVTSDTSPESQQAFLAEARLLSTLRHPHLPRVTDFFIEGQWPCLVMDYIAGKDLDQVLQEAGTGLSLADVQRWIAQVLDALVYLHSQNPPVIHRDIKPSNIRLAADGTIYLVDFGIAKVGNETTRTQRAGQAVSPPFSPPEQYGGSLRTDVRSDVYALGATIYALLTNTLPPDVSSRQIGMAFPTPQLDSVLIKSQIGMLIERAMQMNPLDRYASAQEMATALATLDLEVAPATQRITSPVAKTQVISHGHACPRCGELPITPQAPFCHACGAPILLAFPSIGRLLDSPTDLSSVCDAAWVDATRLVQQGALGRWLEAYGHADLGQQLRSAQVRYPSDPDAALECFLRPNPAEDLEVLPTKVDFGNCPLGSRPTFTLNIQRRTPGFIHGTITSEANWLNVDKRTLRMLPAESSMHVVLSVDMSHLNAQDEQQNQTTTVTIATNRGSIQLPVAISINNPPRIRISANEVNLGKVESFRHVRGQVVIMNEGGGTITGQASSEQPWLAIEAQHSTFTLGYHQQATVHFGVLTTQLHEQGSYQGILRWQTNMGSLATQVCLEVTPPYRLDSDDPASTLKQRNDLIKLCDCGQNQGRDAWSRGLEWLGSGRLEAALRFFGDHQLERQIAQLREKSIDPSIILETLLRACGAKPAKSIKDNAADVTKQLMGLLSRKPERVTYIIRNTSKRGYLYGVVKPIAAWITIPQPRFGCLPGDEAEIEIVPNYAERRSGNLRETIFEIIFD